LEKLWRVKDLLEWTARYFKEKGLEESRLEADILLAHVLEKDRVYLYANYDRPVNQAERDTYRSYIRRRVMGEPVAYITGHKEFMSLDFLVNKDVLIPRPDTEVLVETALEIARNEEITQVCDVGTGSGAIAISLAKLLGDGVMVYGVDISARALEVAAANAERLHVSVDFRRSDLLSAFPEKAKMDLITANLPYIPHAIWQELDSTVRDYEPELALVADDSDGLEIYRRLVPQAYETLRPGGILLMEIDPRQAETAMTIVSGFDEVMIIPDYAGRDRVVRCRRKNEL